LKLILVVLPLSIKTVSIFEFQTNNKWYILLSNEEAFLTSETDSNINS